LDASSSLDELCNSSKRRKRSFSKWPQIKICILINLKLCHLFI
jgi:hypothetical protein